MALPWAKMWVEALDDSKLTRMGLAERGAWWGLIKLARKLDPEGKNSGKIETGGQGLDLEEIADALHIKSDSDRHAFESMISKMESRGSLKWNGRVLTIVHFEQRQKVPKSSTPEAIADRVRRFRDKKRVRNYPIDLKETERLSLRGIRCKAKSKELGRDLSTGERQEIEDQIDKELEGKYGS